MICSNKNTPDRLLNLSGVFFSLLRFNYAFADSRGRLSQTDSRGRLPRTDSRGRLSWTDSRGRLSLLPYEKQPFTSRFLIEFALLVIKLEEDCESALEEDYLVCGSEGLDDRCLSCDICAYGVAVHIHKAGTVEDKDLRCAVLVVCDKDGSARKLGLNGNHRHIERLPSGICKLTLVPSVKTGAVGEDRALYCDIGECLGRIVGVAHKSAYDVHLALGVNEACVEVANAHKLACAVDKLLKTCAKSLNITYDGGSADGIEPNLLTGNVSLGHGVV